MVPDQYMRLSAINLAGDLTKTVRVSQFSRYHTINRALQSRSGRLYCDEDVDFDIPTLELYAAR